MKRGRLAGQNRGARTGRKFARRAPTRPRLDAAAMEASGAGDAALVLSSVIVRAWAVRHRAA